MAIERIFFTIKQDLMLNASRLSEEGARLLKEGKREEGESKIESARAEIGKTRLVDEVVADVLNKLSSAGLEQPSEEYLRQTIGMRLQNPPPEERRGANVNITPITKPPEITAGRRTSVRTRREAGKTKQPPVKRERSPSLELPIHIQPTAYALFAINDARDDYAYSSFERVAETVYADKLNEITNPEERQKRIGGLIGAIRLARGVIAKRVQLTASSSSIPESMQTFLNWLRSQSEYANLSVETLVKIANREISFDQIQKEEGSVATETTANRATQEPSRPESVPSVLTSKKNRTFNFLRDDKSVVIDGEKITLTDVEQKFLEFTYDRRGIVFPASELASFVHGDSNKTPQLRVTVANLRKKIKDDPDNPTFILSTLGRKGGYSFSTSSQSNVLVDNDAPPPTSPDQPVQREMVEEDQDPELTNQEVSLLARRLSEGEYTNKLGLTLHAEDRDEIKSILERFQEPAVEDDSVKASLTKKLLSYLRNREKVFMANLDNEDAQFLLAFLASIESAEKLTEFVQ